MRESEFISNNKKFWRESEKQVDNKSKETGLGDSFIKITDDLSYSQTYYNRRSIRLYLNGLASSFFNKINSSGKDSKFKFSAFWKDELPLIIYQSRKQMLISLVIFVIAVIIGIFSLEHDENFARQILGDSYINMTEDNIAKGDAMAVYKSEEFMEMFFRIWINNLFVSAWIYSLGILLCIGTAGILVYNGVMLGTFQYFFYKKGLFLESFLTIWQHGTIEILSIVIEGGAGLVLGASLLFPGTLPRDVSLKIGAVKSIKIFLGCVPLITIAAFIESFFTRYDDLPPEIRWLVIISSFALMFGYYVVLPFYKGHKFKSEDYDINYDDATSSPVITWGEIKKNSQVFFDTLVLLKDNFSKWLKLSGAIAVIFSIYIVIISPEVYYLDLSLNENLDQFYIFSAFATLNDALMQLISYGSFFHFYDDALLYPLLSFGFAITAYLSFFTTVKSKYEEMAFSLKEKAKTIAFYSLSFLIVFIPFFFEEPFINIGMRFLLIFVLTPIIYWVPHIKVLYNTNFTQSFSRSLDLYFRSLLKLAFLLLILLFLGFLIYIFLTSPLLYITIEMANGFIGFSEIIGIEILKVFILSVSIMGIIIMLGTLLNGMGIFLDSVYEVHTAKNLKSKIQSISTKRKIYGVETE